MVSRGRFFACLSNPFFATPGCDPQCTVLCGRRQILVCRCVPLRLALPADTAGWLSEHRLPFHRPFHAAVSIGGGAVNHEPVWHCGSSLTRPYLFVFPI